MSAPLKRVFPFLRVSLLLAVVLLLVAAPPAHARWMVLLSEGFEYPSDTWPWLRNNIHWQNYPPSQRRWGVEENSVFHVGAPNAVQSLWCAGLPNDLQSGTDLYPPNENTIAYWGYFSLEDAVAATGSVWFWADLEPNTNRTGDDFWVLVTDQQPTTNIDAWDILYQRKVGGTNGIWVSMPFDFEHVLHPNVSADTVTYDTLNYLGRDNLVFALAFKSDSDQNRGLGVFMDDLNVGYDNGMFDFEIQGFSIEDPDDPSIQYPNLYAGIPVHFRTSFLAHGDTLSNEVNHVLYINGDPVDTVTAQWQGSRYGTRYEMVFDYVYTPPALGTDTIEVRLDADDQQVEWSEENNDDEQFIPVQEANTPPWIEFIRPDSTGIEATADSVYIVYHAHNAPVEENANVSFFYTTDNTTSDNAEPIMNGLGLTVSNEQDTLLWRMPNVPNGSYYIMAIMDDYYNDTQVEFSQGTVNINHAGVEDGPVDTQVPGDFRLISLYPNPFNATIDMKFTMPVPGDLNATWYSIDGRQVDHQVFHSLSAGQHRAQWTPSNLPSGTYFLRMQAPKGVATARVIYLK